MGAIISDTFNISLIPQFDSGGCSNRVFLKYTIEDFFMLVEKTILILRGLYKKTLNSSKMKNISKESLMDWFNTRKGLRISAPPFGEKLTSKDVVGVKSAPKRKKKKVAKKPPTFKQVLINKGFTQSWVSYKREGTNKTILRKMKKLIPLEVLRGMKNFDSVFYTDDKELNFSKLYKK